MSLGIKASLVCLGLSIISGIVQVWFNYFLIGVGLGFLGFFLLFPWKQIIRPRDCLSMSIVNIDFSHIKGLKLATKPYIRPIIKFQNNSDLRIHICVLQGTIELGELEPITLKHKLISIKPLSVKAHNEKDDIFHIAVTQDTAKRIVKYADDSANLMWKFSLGVRLSIGFAFCKKVTFFESELEPYRGVPTILDLDLLEKLGEYKKER